MPLACGPHTSLLRTMDSKLRAMLVVCVLVLRVHADSQFNNPWKVDAKDNMKHVQHVVNHSLTASTSIASVATTTIATASNTSGTDKTVSSSAKPTQVSESRTEPRTSMAHPEEPDSETVTEVVVVETKDGDRESDFSQMHEQEEDEKKKEEKVEGRTEKVDKKGMDIVAAKSSTPVPEPVVPEASAERSGSSGRILTASTLSLFVCMSVFVLV